MKTLLLLLMLPGFRTESVAPMPGFATSIVIDSHGTIYATTTDGWIHRIEGDTSTKVASLPTHSGGNGGLLGMALVDDDTAAVHYTTWSGERVLADVVSLVDLKTGAETLVHEFHCDVDAPVRGASDEHHGGNLIVAPDGSIFLGIGEYNDFEIAQDPRWNGGKVFRIHGSDVTQYARGLRNPFDLSWDPESQRIVIADNGPEAGDEIHVIEEGDNCGWPRTYGNQPPYNGAVAPRYVFPETVAPTGMVRLTNDANTVLRRGYLLTAFVTHAIYYFPDLDSDPISLIGRFPNTLLDVTQAPNGDIYFVSSNFENSSHVHRLVVPRMGDCNGDGFTDWRDIPSLLRELEDGDPHPAVTAQDGEHAGSWGCDANADSLINGADVTALTRMISRRRAARAP